MGSVLIDNLNLQEVSLDSNLMLDVFPNKSLSDLINAVILWDNVYYVNNSDQSLWWETYPIIQEWLTFLNKVDISDIEEKALTISRKAYDDNYSDKPGLIASGAIYYLLLSNFLGVSYMPQFDRARFLNENIDLYRVFNRKDLIDYIDKKTEARFNEIVCRLGHRILSFPMPILTELVVNSVDSPDEYINCAIQLRNSNEVKLYRNYMDKIENIANSGSIYELEYILKYADEVIEKIRKIDKQVSVQGNINIDVFPSASGAIDIKLLSPAMVKNRVQNRIHLSFIKTLAKNRLQKKYPRYLNSRKSK